MKAVGYTRALPVTDPESLVDLELPDPEAAANDLVVRVLALSVNPVDTKIRSAVSPEGGAARVLGWDACGVVESIGEAVQEFAEGDRVWYAGELDRQGCNAEHQAVDARIVSRAPTSIPAAEAAALPLTSVTAWEALFERLGYSEEPSDGNRERRLLLINGAGGVGSIALQLCRMADIPVTATASRDESRAWCYEKGATEVVRHDELADIEESSFARILCCHDTDAYFDAMARLVAPQGLVCGLASAKRPHDIQALMSKSAGFVWELIFTRSRFRTSDMKRQAHILATVAKLVDEGRIVTTLSDRRQGLSAENLREMHRLQESGGLIGKQVLTVGES